MTDGSIAASLKEAQRQQNNCMSAMIADADYRKAFKIFYTHYSFAWIPKWLQRKLEPMAYRCFRAGISYEFGKNKD